MSLMKQMSIGLMSAIFLSVFFQPVLAVKFPDVSYDNINYFAVEYLAEKGIISGHEDGNFYPHKAVNRAEFLKMVLLSAEELKPVSNNFSFQDVNPWDWFFNYVTEAYTHGIIKGYPDGTFRPAQTVNRVEALKMLLKAHQINTRKPSDDLFEDVRIEEWFSEYVSYAITKNLIKITETKFHPETEMTRSELAEIIYRLIMIDENGLQSYPTYIDPYATGEIKTTNGVMHSVPLADVLEIGPQKDSIPTIDNPKFTSISDASEFLDDNDMGVSISYKGINRFYPNKILFWHELVNDLIDDKPILIAYCIPCDAGIIMERKVDGKIIEFGTSGRIWNDRLIIYDRQTNSYWSEVGEAIIGELTGKKLRKLITSNMSWSSWKRKYKSGDVLSYDTGYFQGLSPSSYGNINFEDPNLYPSSNDGDKYYAKEFSKMVIVNDEAKIYTSSELMKSPEEFQDNVGGVELSIKYRKIGGHMSITRNDTGKSISPIHNYWFILIEEHPDAEVYKAK